MKYGASFYVPSKPTIPTSGEIWKAILSIHGNSKYDADDFRVLADMLDEDGDVRHEFVRFFLKINEQSKRLKVIPESYGWHQRMPRPPQLNSFGLYTHAGHHRLGRLIALDLASRVLPKLQPKLQHSKYRLWHSFMLSHCLLYNCGLVGIKKVYQCSKLFTGKFGIYRQLDFSRHVAYSESILPWEASCKYTWMCKQKKRADYELYKTRSAGV